MRALVQSPEAAAFHSAVTRTGTVAARLTQQLADQFGVHVSQITAWKEQLQTGAVEVFGSGLSGKPSAPEVDIKSLHAKIGELTLENDPRSGRGQAF